MKKALYLAGGGARGAYQVGALKGICDIVKSKTLPVQIISSVSSGSINASYLAMYPEDFSCAVDKLIELWSSLSSDKIFKTSNFSLLHSVFRNTLSVIMHNKTPGGGYLFNTTPLLELLNKNLNFEKINDNIKKGLVTDFDLATTCYDSSLTVSFFNSQHTQENWKTIGHISVPTDIHCHHILASTAIPLFFPAVKINDLYYGDGSVGLTSPLRAAVKFNADDILVIGTGEVPAKSAIHCEPAGPVTFGKIFGSIMHRLFISDLAQDILTLKKINHAITYMSEQGRVESDWRKINVLYLHPTQSLSNLAMHKEKVLPFFLRYLITAFGKKNKPSEYLSFLLFEGSYCKELITMGYEDTLNRKDEIKEFFLSQ